MELQTDIYHAFLKMVESFLIYEELETFSVFGNGSPNSNPLIDMSVPLLF